MSHCVGLMNKRSSIKPSESTAKSDGHSAHEIWVTLSMHSGSGDFTDFIFAQPYLYPDEKLMFLVWCLVS
jgi:hypothetical protein